MTTMYVVTDGEYSDYHVVCVYADEALANRHVEIEHRSAFASYCRVEEYEVVETEPQGFDTHYRRVGLYFDGSVTVDMQHSQHRVQDGPTPVSVRQNSEFRLPPYPAWAPLRMTAMDIYGEGTDLVRLEKAMAERVAKLQAELADVRAGLDEPEVKS